MPAERGGVGVKTLRERLGAKLAELIGPSRYWTGNGVLGVFKGHDLEILVSADTPGFDESTFGKTWHTDADEVIFRRGKQIKLYWRKRA